MPDEPSAVAHEQPVESRRLYEGTILNLREDTLRLPSGRRAPYLVVEHPGAVVILAIDGEGRVLLVRQYRHPTGRSLLELPAGTRDPGEQPLACAERELREETGFRPGRLERMGGFYSAPGYCTEYLEAYLATDLEPAPLESGDEEGLQVEALPLEQLLVLAAEGRLEDAKSLATLLLYLQRRRPSR